MQWECLKCRGAGAVGWDPVPRGTGHCFSFSLCRGKGSSEHPRKPQALLWGPFFDATCGHVIWAIPVGSLELSGHQQPLGEWQQMLCTSFLPWSTRIAVEHYSFHRASAIACSQYVGDSYELLSGNLAWYKLHFFWPMLVCHAWDELGKAAFSLAGCLNAITLQSGSTVLFMQFISQPPVIRKAKPIVFCGGAGLCSPLPWCAGWNCPEAVQERKGWQGFA